MAKNAPERFTGMPLSEAVSKFIDALEKLDDASFWATLGTSESELKKKANQEKENSKITID